VPGSICVAISPFPGRSSAKFLPLMLGILNPDYSWGRPVCGRAETLKVGLLWIMGSWVLSLGALASALLKDELNWPGLALYCPGPWSRM
jgi:hypothetical protein